MAIEQIQNIPLKRCPKKYLKQDLWSLGAGCFPIATFKLTIWGE